jgi:hypothetical protein
MATALSGLALVATVAHANPEAQHVVGRAELDAAIAVRDAGEAAQRATIQSLLSRPDVREWAAGAGLDLERAQQRAATLQGEELQRIASHARLAEAHLAGGDSLVIGSTALIIILLVIVIILVA